MAVIGVIMVVVVEVVVVLGCVVMVSHDPLPPPCYTGTKITQWSFLEIIDFGKGLLVSFYAVAQLRS